MNRIFFGNTVEDYLWVIGIILFTLLLNRIISKYIALLLCRAFKRYWINFDQRSFIDLIIHPLGIFLLITVSIIALYRLSFPEQLDVKLYKFPLHQIFLSIGIAVQLGAFTWLLLRIIDFIAGVLQRRAEADHDIRDSQLVVFFRDFLKVIIGIIGFMLILHFAFEYNIGTLLTGLSIVGAAIALALRESLENLIASFVIFFDKPFRIGDTVKVQNILGVVEKIGLRSTRIRSDQKTYVTVPNKQMVDSILDNYSERTQQRNELLLQLSLDTPLQKLQTLMDALKEYLSGIKEIENFNVLFLDINPQAYVVQIETFVAKQYLSQFNAVKGALNAFALKKAEELEIKIAGSGKLFLR